MKALLLLVILALEPVPPKKVYIGQLGETPGVIVTMPAPGMPFGLIVPFSVDEAKSIGQRLQQHCKGIVEISHTREGADYVLAVRPGMKGADLRAPDGTVVYSTERHNETRIGFDTCDYLKKQR